MGGVSCAVTSNINTNNAVCSAPVGVGQSLTIKLCSTWNGVTRCTERASSFSYNVGTLTSIGTVSTAGGSLTVQGSSLGASPGKMFVFYASAWYEATCSAGGWSHTSVTCTVNAGVGSNIPVYIKTTSGDSNQMTFSYPAPLITEVSPTSGNTPGGYSITVKGSNFGTAQGSSAFFIGSTKSSSCSSWASTQFVCVVPAGTGASKTASVTVGSQASNQGMTFSYNAPTIGSFAISVQTASTDGGYVMTLAGTNFGAGSSVTFNGISITAVTTSNSDQALSFTVPAGSGKSLIITVTCASQTSNGITFSYAGPTISKLTGTVNTEGGSVLTLDGTNFMGGSTLPTVSVGGANCPLTGTSTSSKILCTAPATTSSSSNPLSVVLSANGQVSNTMSVTLTSPTVASLGSSSGSTAGFSMTIAGTNFGINAAIVSVSVAAGTDTPAAAVVTSVSHKQLVVTIPQLSGGSGTSLFVYVAVGGVSVKSTATFNYLPPTLSGIVGSILTSGTGVVTISGSNFGANSGGNSVTKISSTGALATFNIQSWSHTSIVGVFPAGSGVKNNVLVTSGGQQSNVLVDIKYPAPSVSSVSPTSGNVGGNIVIQGNNFGTAGTATIGSLTVTTSGWTHTGISGTIPDGFLFNQPIQLVVDGQTSNTDVTFSFAGPSITDVKPVIGSTSGSTQVTLTGVNFGASGAKSSVTLGTGASSVVCTISSWTSSTIIFLTPAGQGTSILITVSTLNSVTTSASATFSYSAPVISSVTPATINTDGTSLVTVAGSNFGTAPVVTLGGIVCAQQSKSHTEVVCSAPSGVGTSIAVVLSAGGQAASSTVSYTAPSISSLFPTSTNSEKLETITLTGSQFGNDNSVVIIKVAGASVPLATISQTRITFSAPVGTAQTATVALTVAGQSSNTATLAFNDPVITTVSPQGQAPQGGSALTIAGTSLFTSAVATVTVGGKSCPVVTDTGAEIVCTLPAGSGSGNLVVVSVGQRSSTQKVFYTYASATITSVFIPGQTGNNTLLNTAGSEQLTINGNNFGSFPDVSLGGTSLLVVSSSATQIVVRTPAGAGINAQLAVSFSGMIAGCATASVCQLSYAVPTISSVTPATAPTEVFVLTVAGSNFGANVGSVTVGSYVCSASGSGTFHTT